jgi:hypothetical protein
MVSRNSFIRQPQGVYHRFIRFFLALQPNVSFGFLVQLYVTDFDKLYDCLNWVARRKVSAINSFVFHLRHGPGSIPGLHHEGFQNHYW